MTEPAVTTTTTTEAPIVVVPPEDQGEETEETTVEEETTVPEETTQTTEPAGQTGTDILNDPEAMQAQNQTGEQFRQTFDVIVNLLLILVLGFILVYLIRMIYNRRRY